jgi:hypothetical protein
VSLNIIFAFTQLLCLYHITSSHSVHLIMIAGAFFSVHRTFEIG